MCFFLAKKTFSTLKRAQFESKLWDGLCNQFGIVKNRTTSYHPQSNGMVERFHRQLKAAIMAHESPNPWTITLPSVLLGVRSAVKELLGSSAAEMIYGHHLDYQENLHRNIPSTHMDNYSDELRDKIIADATVKKTIVGRTIQTPARFMQMVHAIDGA